MSREGGQTALRIESLARLPRRPHELFPSLRLSPFEALAFDNGVLTAAELERAREVDNAISDASFGQEGSVEKVTAALLALIHIKGR
jgi:hypothetical protein